VIAITLLMLAAPAAPKALPPRPIDFGAATMTLEPKANRTLLEGDVWFDRKDLRVTGERATAEFAEAEKAGKKESTLQSFTVEGKVHVERPGPQSARTADGSEAVYDAPKGTLLLSGPPAVPPPGLQAAGPVLRDGPELMIGERVLMHVETDEVEVQRPRLWLKRSLPADDKAAKGAPQPVRVEAGALRLDQQRKVARFRDKVVIHRGDLTVKGPRMDARYDQAGQLTTLELRGGVEMVEGERRAVGQNADYDAAARTLVLTGDPKLFDRGDVLRGTKITMQVDTHEVKVERATGRLRPDEHKGQLGGKP
jgi:lipopolysaccharide transport protein LptA